MILLSELAAPIHLFATLSMCGLIWFVQVVHYPLFAQVDRAVFQEYERLHQTRTTIVVAPLMLAEAATAGWLILLPPAGVSPWMIYLAAGMLAAIWLSTFLWQVPKHEKLSQTFDDVTHRQLVQSNWVRTILWNARGVLAILIAIDTFAA